jgi:hypothetical protein
MFEMVCSLEQEIVAYYSSMSNVYVTLYGVPTLDVGL